MGGQFVGAVVLCALLVGCAGASREAKPVDLERTFGEKLTIPRRVSLPFKPGISLASIEKGTSFEQVGRIPQGNVYRSPNTTLQVRSWNVHEAYLVVNQSDIVGVYLPYQRGFLACSKPISLSEGGSP